MAEGRQQGEGGAGTVMERMALPAGGAGGHQGSGSGEAAALLILHQAVLRNHQGQAAINQRLRRQQLF